MRAKGQILKEKKDSNFVLAIIKGSLIALCTSFIGILIFAFLLKFTNISDKFITPINEVIKGVSIFFGVFIGFKREKKLGLIGGFLIGLIFTILAFISFSLLGGGFNFDLTLLYDTIFGGILGGICGVICVNIKKNYN